MSALTARDLIDRLLDPCSWRSWDEEADAGLPAERADEASADPTSADASSADAASGAATPSEASSARRRWRPSPSYAADLRRARDRTGLSEAVLTGQGTVLGRPLVVVAGEFGFLGGSIGVAAAERLVHAVERATAERLPVLAAPASGGTRMQEGTVAFLQMVKITAAVAAHRAAGLPYLVYLRHPTTGGVFASWGSLGHITAAEPGALIGFLGPRVFEALNGEPFPEGVQVAENLLAHGLLDAVLTPDELRTSVAAALDLMQTAETPSPVDSADGVPPGPTTPTSEASPSRSAAPWESVRRSRRRDRPGVRSLLRAADQELRLRGTGAGETEPGLLLALARFGAARCVLLGQDRERQSQHGPFGPAGLRVARRGMALAAELTLPLVTVVDTPGAALSRQAEEGGLAGEIARCLADLVTLPAPTLCLLLGEGAGGGALALFPADRVLAAAHGWLSPLPPEGASALLHRTVEEAPRLADEQGITAPALYRSGIVDRVVPEHPDAADEPEAFLTRLVTALSEELAALTAADPAQRLAARHARHRRLDHDSGPGPRTS